MNEIVKTTTSNVEGLMLQARNKVEKGSEVAESCGEVLQRIVTNANQLSEMVENISVASQEQASGIRGIAQAIQQINETTKINSTETEATNSSALNLGSQVKSLNQSSYKLKLLIDGGIKKEGTLVNEFVWKDKYKLGVDQMDSEHKVLIFKINTLAESINENKPSSVVSSNYLDLANYTKKHFSDEEAYMGSINYPDLNQHKETHKKLLSKLSQFEDSIGRNSFDSSGLMSFLNDWLVKHILGADMKYAQHSHRINYNQNKKAV